MCLVREHTHVCRVYLYHVSLCVKVCINVCMSGEYVRPCPLYSTHACTQTHARTHPPTHPHPHTHTHTLSLSHTHTQMPHYVVSHVQRALNDSRKPVNGARALLLGIAYKPNLGDTRETPAFVIWKLLREMKVSLSTLCPFPPSFSCARTLPLVFLIHCVCAGRASTCHDICLNQRLIRVPSALFPPLLRTQKKQAEVSYYDPLVPEIRGHLSPDLAFLKGVRGVGDADVGRAVEEADVVVVVTPHK